MPDLNGQERNEVNLEMFKNSFRVIHICIFLKMSNARRMQKEIDIIKNIEQWKFHQNRSKIPLHSPNQPSIILIIVEEQSARRSTTNRESFHFTDGRSINHRPLSRRLLNLTGGAVRFAVKEHGWRRLCSPYCMLIDVGISVCKTNARGGIEPRVSSATALAFTVHVLEFTCFNADMQVALSRINRDASSTEILLYRFLFFHGNLFKLMVQMKLWIYYYFMILCGKEWHFDLIY